MAEEKKILKVQFFYDDGSSKYIEGLELERWNGFLSQITVMASARGMNPDWSKVKWKEQPVQIQEKILSVVDVKDTEELQEGLTKKENENI